MPAPLRFGFISGNFITAFHLRALQQVRGVEVAGFVGRTSAARHAEFCRTGGLGEARVFDSIAGLADAADVLCIYGPNFTRIEVVEEIAAAVEKGAALKGLICEKPLGRNLAEAGRMVELAEQMGVQTAYFENQIHMKSVKVARQQLAPVIAAMGPPVLVRSGEEHGGPHNAWFWDPRQQGGGVMSDMGCHCLGVGWFALTPPDRDVRFLEPISVSADLSLLKWGQPKWRDELKSRYGVDDGETPAEDFATGMVTYRNPESGHISKAQFSVSWMYDYQAMRLALEGIGPGYAFDMSTHKSPSVIFIGDAAAAGTADSELAMEKSQASRGLLPVQPNEPDLYGYVDENIDAVEAFSSGRPPLLDWNYGREIVRLTMAAYLSAEERRTIDLNDAETAARLEEYIPLIQQGRGAEVLSM